MQLGCPRYRVLLIFDRVQVGSACLHGCGGFKRAVQQAHFDKFRVRDAEERLRNDRQNSARLQTELFQPNVLAVGVHSLGLLLLSLLCGGECYRVVRLLVLARFASIFRGVFWGVFLLFDIVGVVGVFGFVF